MVLKLFKVKITTGVLGNKNYSKFHQKSMKIIQENVGKNIRRGHLLCQV